MTLRMKLIVIYCLFELEKIKSIFFFQKKFEYDDGYDQNFLVNFVIFQKIQISIGKCL